MLNISKGCFVVSSFITQCDKLANLLAFSCALSRYSNYLLHLSYLIICSGIFQSISEIGENAGVGVS